MPPSRSKKRFLSAVRKSSRLTATSRPSAKTTKGVASSGTSAHRAQDSKKPLLSQVCLSSDDSISMDPNPDDEDSDSQPECDMTLPATSKAPITSSAIEDIGQTVLTWSKSALANRNDKDSRQLFHSLTTVLPIQLSSTAVKRSKDEYQIIAKEASHGLKKPKPSSSKQVSEKGKGKGRAKVDKHLRSFAKILIFYTRQTVVSLRLLLSQSFLMELAR